MIGIVPDVNQREFSDLKSSLYFFLIVNHWIVDSKITSVFFRLRIEDPKSMLPVELGMWYFSNKCLMKRLYVKHPGQIGNILYAV